MPSNAKDEENSVTSYKDPEDDEIIVEMCSKEKALSCAKTIFIFLLIIITVYSILAYIIVNESKKKGKEL